VSSKTKPRLVSKPGLSSLPLYLLQYWRIIFSFQRMQMQKLVSMPQVLL